MRDERNAGAPKWAGDKPAPSSSFVRGRQPQPVLAPCPPVARYLTFALAQPKHARARLDELPAFDGKTIIGLGAPLVPHVGDVAGLRRFPALSPLYPATQGALWVALVHGDASAIFDRALAITRALGDAFSLVEDVPAFTYQEGRDLSGFVDGTENPTGADAEEAALVAEGARAQGSFVLVQRWWHDMNALARMKPRAKSAAVGRDWQSNEELTDAPPSAHVKRTAQEDFDPPSFLVRRSMAWGGPSGAGLYFIAYTRDLDTVERHLSRMAGLNDGIVDALFSFTRPRTGGYYWCPPIVDGRLALP
jgi:putative iron-dependent peroxidase